MKGCGEMDVASFKECCKANSEVESLFLQAVDFVTGAKDPEWKREGYFTDFKDYYASSTLAQGLIDHPHLIQYPFEDELFRGYLLQADREIAEILLSEGCRGYSYEEVKKVTEEARALKHAQRLEVQTLLHSPNLELAHFQNTIKTHPLFTRVAYGVVKFAALQGATYPHQELLEATLLRLYRVKKPLVPATLLSQVSQRLPPEEACNFMVKVAEEGPPSWSLYMWHEYMERFEEFEGVFLPWVEAFLAPARGEHAY